MKYESGSFITVPNRQTLDGLPVQAQALFMWMSYYANQSGECFPSRSTLAKNCGWSDIKNVDKWILVLIQAGILEKNERFKGNEQLSNIYAIIIGGVGVRNGLGRGQKRTTPQGSETDTELKPSSLTKTKNTACVLKNSKGEDLSSIPASDYQPDGWSPTQVMSMKKRAERVLGIRKTNSWSQLLFGSAWDFKKAYTKFQGVDYVGEIFVDEMARTLATWYEAGETRDTIRGLIVEYFQSEKAERLAVTPNACFSDHTYQSWKQGKLNKNKDNSILKSWGV